MVKVLILADSISIPFWITNKTEHSVKLVWDEATFIGVGGLIEKVMHAGIKYADRNGLQPPSVIPAGQTYVDAAYPNDRVYFREGYYGTYYSSPGGWEHLSLILPAAQVQPGHSPIEDQAFAARVAENKGKRFGLVLPLEIEGVTNEYTFWFEVTSAKVIPLGSPSAEGAARAPRGPTPAKLDGKATTTNAASPASGEQNPLVAGATVPAAHSVGSGTSDSSSSARSPAQSHTGVLVGHASTVPDTSSRRATASAPSPRPDSLLPWVATRTGVVYFASACSGGLRRFRERIDGTFGPPPSLSNSRTDVRRRSKSGARRISCVSTKDDSPPQRRNPERASRCTSSGFPVEQSSRR